MSEVLAPAAPLPALPPATPSRDFPIFGPLGRLVLRALGWKLAGGFPNVPRAVLIGWPHTSNWDGIVGLSAAAVSRLDFRFFAKRQLFWPPSGWMLRALGGIPIERTKAGGLVERAVDRFARAEARGEGFILGVAPEGTRSRGERWKSGYHRIARAAGVPIVVVALDHGRKRIEVLGAIVPTDDREADERAITAMLEGVEGRHPEKATPAA